jgi:hypothetical protein
MAGRGRPKKSQIATIASNIDENQDDMDFSGEPENITFDFKAMSKNFDNVLLEINDKLKSAQIKLTALKDKEDILMKMINITNSQMETTPKENFKLIGIYQSQLMKQFESLNLWQESLMKYEDLIQRYLKMRIDIENHKLNSFAKIKSLYKAADEAEEGFDTLLKNIHNITSGASSNGIVDLQHEAMQQLKIAGY